MDEDPNVKFRKLDMNLNYGLFASDFASWHGNDNIYKKNSLETNMKLCNSTCDKITYISENKKDCKRVCMDHIGEIIREVPFTKCFKRYSNTDWLALYSYIYGTKIPDLYFLPLIDKIDKNILDKCKSETCKEDGICDREFETILNFINNQLVGIEKARKRNMVGIIENYESTNPSKKNKCHIIIIIMVVVMILLCFFSLLLTKMNIK